MIVRGKKIVGRFYATAAGRRPVREWLLELSKDDRRVIGRDIQKVEFGWPLGMPIAARWDAGFGKCAANFPAAASRA